MVIQSWLSKYWQFGLATALTLGGGIFPNERSTLAQLIPDNTLGAESSVVTPVDATNDRIDGGATRGANLFHSFQEFNVGEARSVYFANPDGIANILSRVTGSNTSNILGRLGVLGEANLFLLNPNGIIFGANASLDIKGSFVATTAEGIALGEQGFFSATEPQNSTLLAVNPGSLFFNQVANQSRVITNFGNLVVGNDFTLAADNLNLQGQVLAGENLILQAIGALQITDSVTNPFIASAGNQLLIEGNQGINIFALNHPNSGLFSGGDLVLLSANPVAGDARFLSGGNFRVEQLDGNLGGLISFNAPVIRSAGDVALGFYQGASLHVLAGGSVTIPGFVQITSAAPFNGIVEDVILSDGTIVAINGQNQPTVDIRSGTTAVDSFFLNPKTPTSADINVGSISIAKPLPTDPSRLERLAGKVLLTNQFQSNPSLIGNIQVGTIQTGDFKTSGGQLALDSKGKILVSGNISSSAIPTITFPSTGNGGNISFLAQDSINFVPNSFISSLGLLGGNITLKSQEAISLDGVIIQNENHSPLPDLKGGNINITARILSLKNGAAISTRTWGRANSGDININVLDSITIDGVRLQFNGAFVSSGIVSNVGSGANANAGNINITASSLALTNGAQIQSAVESANIAILPIFPEPIELPAGQGKGGKVSIDVRDAVILDGESNGLISGIGSFLNQGATGNGGDIEIKAGSLSMINGGLLSTSTGGQGNAGNVIIDVDGAINFDGVSSEGFTSGILSQVELGGIGKGGNVSITGRSLSLSNGAQITTSVGRAFGDFPASQGEAGNVKINVLDAVTIDGVANTLDFLGQPTILPSGITSSLDVGTRGSAGTIDITAESLSLTNGGQLLTESFGEGNAGNINIDIRGEVTIAGVDSSKTFNSGLFTALELQGVGKGGEIDVKGRSLSITDGGTINSSTSGRGDAGNVSINVSQDVTVAGVNNDSGFLSLISSGVFPEAIGRGGDIEITAGSIFVADNGRLSTETQTISSNTENIDAGNIFLKVNDTLSLTNGGQLRSDTSGKGNAGNVTINAPNAVISLDGSSIFNEELIISGIATVVQPIEESTSDRTGGDINITAKSLSITNGAELNARTEGVGNAGNVNIDVAEAITLNDPFSGIFTRVESGSIGDGGDITINAESLFLSNGAQLATDTLGIGNAGNINLDIRAEIEVRDFATIPIDGVDFPLQTAIASGVAPEAVGNGGDINIKAESVTLNNFSLITTATLGQGNAGNISLQVDDFVNLSRLSVIESLVSFGAVGEGGDIDIQARSLTLTDASQIEALLIRETNGIPGGQGKAGNIRIETSDFVSISGVSKVQLPVADPTFPSQFFPTEGFSSGLLASAEKGTIGSAGNISITTGTFQIADGAIVNTLTTNADNAGDITINAKTFKATGGGQILVTTRSSGNAGDIKLNIANNITLSGKDPNFEQRLAKFGEDIVNNQGAESGIFANTTANSTGQGGNVEIETNSVVLDDRGTIVANSQGQGIAGNLTINATGNINATDSNITTSADRTSGGAITVTARNIRLEGNSDIRTNVASGTGGGGDITITADSILAFADSDILAFARDGKGGNIILDTPVFFGSRFQPASEGTNPDTLDNNNRVDINASGAVAGAITIPDVSFIQNSLTDLPGNLIDTEAIIANSCVVRSREKEGKFIITGAGGLPVRPGDLSIAPYATGTVRNVPQQESSSDSWQIGDAVVEPQGVYRLGNGQLILSRECQ